MTSKPNVDLSVRVDGLRELRKAINDAEQGAGRELGQAGKSAADIVARTAVPKVPVLTGAARGSVRAVVSQGGGGVRAGGARVPYFSWLNFGGRVGRNKSVGRERVKPDRYVYTSLAEKHEEVLDEYEHAVNELLRRVGLK